MYNRTAPLCPYDFVSLSIQVEEGTLWDYIQKEMCDRARGVDDHMGGLNEFYLHLGGTSRGKIFAFADIQRQKEFLRVRAKELGGFFRVCLAFKPGQFVPPKDTLARGRDLQTLYA